MGQMTKAIQMLMTLGISAGAIALSAGCNPGGPVTRAGSKTQNDVTDVKPIETASTVSYQPPVYDTTATIPTAPQALTADRVAAAPASKSEITPVMSTTPTIGSTGENKHTVRHGETLFSIAKANYGDGKAWKKIVLANPGLTPAKLRVGQVLSMPS